MGFDFDVVVAGAGPAGCLAARDLARAGLRVGLFDRSPAGKLGKPVVVELEKSIFQRVGLRPLTPEEIPYHAGKARVFSSRNVQAYVVDRGLPTVAVHLDRFSRRLLREARREASLRFLGGHEAEGLVRTGGRVVGAVFRNGQARTEFRARLVIDATGFEAALVRSLDPALGFGFHDEPGDVIRAANALHKIDTREALRAVREGRHADEELRIRLGTLGPYALEFSFLSVRNELAYILIGHKEEYEAPPMRDLLRAFAEQQGYYRKRIHGGQGRIRVAPILDRLVCDGFMVLGEAACMVIPVNGSGVSSALLAGHLAARTAAAALRAGRSDTASLWPYAARFQRSRGAVLASYTAVRYMTEALGRKRSDTLLESGISQGEDLINANIPRPLSFSPAALPPRLPGLVRHPDLIPPLVRGAAAVRALYKHHRRYPETFDAAALEHWRARRRRIHAWLPGGTPPS